MKQNIKRITIFLLAIFLIIPSVSHASEYETYVNIPVEVNVEGDTPETDYTFSIEAKENAMNYLPDESQINIAKNSKGEFGPIRFDAPGKYSYIIKQVAGDNINTTYDKSFYEVDIHVINEQDENGSYTGRLAGVIVSYLNGEEVKSDKIIFKNLFKLPQPIEYELPIKKSIIGDKPKEDVPFTFKMTAISTTAEDEKVMPLPEGGKDGVKEVIHEGEGEFEFGLISFKKPGIYTYEITEVNTQIKNYKYDDSKFVVEYNVKQEADKLYADIKYTKNGQEVKEIEFVNEYKKTVDKTIGENPRTGDSFNVPLYIGIVLVTILAFVLIKLYKNKSVEK